MNTYTAKFQNGHSVARNSKREYQAAWAIFQPNATLPDDYGFSATSELAQKAATARANWLAKNIAGCQNGYTIFVAEAVGA